MDMLRKVLSFYTKYFALTMFGIGVVLQAEDFKRIAQKPGIVLIGYCAGERTFR